MSWSTMNCKTIVQLHEILCYTKYKMILYDYYEIIEQLYMTNYTIEQIT